MRYRVEFLFAGAKPRRGRGHGGGGGRRLLECCAAGETHVEVVVNRLPGTWNAETRRFHVVLNTENAAYEVCKIRM
jgi:hypothetical protein